jgi:hypothetical protein
MTDMRQDKAPPGNGNGAEDRLVARLIKLAGRRPPVPDARTARVRAAVHAEWQDTIRSRRRRRTTTRAAWSLAAAAMLILIAGLVAWQAGVGPWSSASPVASVELVHSAVQLAASDSASRAGESESARAGMELRSGAVVETDVDGLLALRFGTGHSVRLDGATRLRVRSADRLELQRGAVYVDSGPDAGAGKALVVDTPFGSAREIGTQFEVRLDGNAMRLRVREGAVDLEHQGQSQTAQAGIELELNASGELRRGEIPLYGSPWDWVQRSAPAIDLDGTTLDRFLSWAARETGMKVLFLDASTAEAAPGISLSGSIEGLDPQEALSAVLPTCGLSHRIEQGTLIIDPNPAAGEARP